MYAIGHLHRLVVLCMYDKCRRGLRRHLQLVGVLLYQGSGCLRIRPDQVIA